MNHDILMDRLAKRIGDKRILRLVRRYLQAGIMADGVVLDRLEGTPQGSPLSPLLANVLLDEVDKELERRGHKFARYADDANVYVRSQRAGERVLESLRCLYAKLHLKVNEGKTAVGSAFGRKFLGYCLRRGEGPVVKLSVAPRAIEAFKHRIREMTCRGVGRSMVDVAEQMRRYIPGWRSTFVWRKRLLCFKTLISSTGNRALLCIKDSEGWVQQRSWPLRRPQTGVEDGGDEASIPAFTKFSRCPTSIVWAYRLS